MENEKCFCHLNGYKVKDADARKNIDDLNTSLNTLESETNTKLSTLESETNTKLSTLESETENSINDINTNINSINTTISTLSTETENVANQIKSVAVLKTRLQYSTSLKTYSESSITDATILGEFKSMFNKLVELVDSGYKPILILQLADAFTSEMYIFHNRGGSSSGVTYNFIGVTNSAVDKTSNGVHITRKFEITKSQSDKLSYIFRYDNFAVASYAGVGDINNLTTTDKTSIVNAINELASNSGGGTSIELEDLTSQITFNPEQPNLSDAPINKYNLKRFGHVYYLDAMLDYVNTIDTNKPIMSIPSEYVNNITMVASVDAYGQVCTIHNTGEVYSASGNTIILSFTWVN